MFDIKNTTILFTRGDEISFDIELEEGFFEVGDIVRFAIYKEHQIKDKPVFYKTFEINEKSDTMTIDLTSSETEIGEMKNSDEKYWYEIKLNGNNTLIGYKKDQIAQLIVLPEGGKADGE